MAGNFVDSLLIAIGLDTKGVAEGVQQVGAQLDSGLSAAAQSAASKMSPLGEALKGLADKAGEVAKPAKESLQALHGLGLKAASEYQEQIDAIKAGLAQIQNDPALSASDKASAMDAASAKIDELKTKMDGLKEPASEAMQVLKDLGIRTTEEIQKSLDALKAKLAAVQNDPALTARDKMAAMKELQAQIERTEMELKRGLPQAAAQGFAGAEAAANKFKGFMSSIWAQVSGPLMGAFAIGGSVSSFISNSMSAGELAEKLKVDVEEIQIWSGAMERAGGSAASLQATIEKLNASGKANGDVFGTLMDLAAKAETMGKEAFIEHAKRLEIDEKTIEVLAQGKKALEAHLKKQEELGVYTKEDAEQSKAFKQGLADLLQAWDGLTSFIGRFAVPVMTAVAAVLTGVVADLRAHTPFVVAAIGTVGAALAYRLMPPLKELPKLVSGVSKAFLRWMPFVAVIAGIALLIDDFYAYLTGGQSALEDVWAIFGTGPEIMAKLAAAWEVLKGGIRTAWEGIKQFIAYMRDLAEASGWLDGLKNALKGVAQIFKGLFSGNAADIGKGFGRLFRGLGQMVLGSLRSLGTIIKDLVKGWFSFDGEGITLSGVVSAIWKAITTAFTNIGKFIASFWEGAFDIELPSLDELGKKIWNTIKNVIDDLKKMIPDAFKNLFKDIKFPSVKDLLGGAGDIAGGAVDLVKGGLGKAGDFFGDLFKGAGPETAKAGAQVEDGMARTAGNVEGGFMTTWMNASNAAVSLFGGAAKDIRAMFSGIFAELQAQAQSMVAGARAMVAGGGAMVPAYAGVRAQNAGARNVNQSSSVHIGTMNVQTQATDAKGVARGMQGALSKNSLVRTSQTGTVQK